MSRRSTEAVATVKRICDERLNDRYELDVIDLYRSPARAREDQIIATPTLVRHEPEPSKRLIGGLGDIQRIIDGLILAT
jgi:circadian clock protein KaiB